MRAAILLAAGSSRRFGRRNKLLATLEGRPLLEHALLAARMATDGRIIVVTGADRAKISRFVQSMRMPCVRLIHAARHRQGMSASLAAGLATLRPIERQFFLFLGDAPFMAKQLPRALIKAMRPRIDAVRPMHRGVPGHPVLVRTAIARQAAPKGDRGLGPLLNSARVHTIEVGPLSVNDIDTPAALRKAGAIAPGTYGLLTPRR
jgi:molybdenum cofactor cytidylyltransferase